MVFFCTLGTLSTLPTLYPFFALRSEDIDECPPLKSTIGKAKQNEAKVGNTDDSVLFSAPKAKAYVSVSKRPKKGNAISKLFSAHFLRVEKAVVILS